jgi:predicted secreted protein
MWVTAFVTDIHANEVACDGPTLRSRAACADAVRMQLERRFLRAGRAMAATLTAVVLAVVLGACGGSSGPKAGATPTFTNPNRPIEVKRNQEFAVRLAANATTGYSWRVGQTVPALVKQLDAHYVAPKTGRVGAGGTAVIRFRATQRGTGGLGLAYVGPGTNAPIARTVTFQLTVS